jgi:rhodanese-related sulfurtransferase
MDRPLVAEPRHALGLGCLLAANWLVGPESAYAHAGPRATEVIVEMRNRIWLYTILLGVAALLLASCGAGGTTSNEPQTTSLGFAKNVDGYADISVGQLAEILDSEDLTLVNVHIPYEGELPQTDLLIPYNEIGDHLDELPAKDAPIVLYCRSGSMSTTAAEILADEGYTNVMELDGGFNAWEAAGHELLMRQ